MSAKKRPASAGTLPGTVQQSHQRGIVNIVKHTTKATVPATDPAPLNSFALVGDLSALADRLKVAWAALMNDPHDVRTVLAVTGVILDAHHEVDNIALRIDEHGVA